MPNLEKVYGQSDLRRRRRRLPSRYLRPDADYYIPGLTHGEVVIDSLKSWKGADIPAPEILKIMTVNGYRVCDMYDKRGPIKVGLPADLIAVRGNPLQEIDTLRDVRFVMKDRVIFKRDGPVPPSAWRIH